MKTSATTLAAFLLLPTMGLSNTCVEGKPAKISGALCGKTFDPIGAIAPNTGLRVADASGNVVANTRTGIDIDQEAETEVRDQTRCWVLLATNH